MIRPRHVGALVLGLGAVFGAMWLSRPEGEGQPGVLPRRAATGAGAPGGARSAAPARNSMNAPVRRDVRDAGPLAHSRRLAQLDPRRSREVLRNALEEDPDNVRLLGALAMKLVLDESTEARPLAIRCLNISPDDPTCKEALRRALDRDPRDDTTSKFFDECLSRGDNRGPCLAGVAVEHLRRGDVEGAGTVARQMRKHAPDSPLTALVSARVHSAEGDYRQALRGFDAACAGGQDYGCFRARALRRDGW